MTNALALDEMNTAEKLRVMESLWDDLCRGDEELTSPAWHKQVLDEREQALRQGTEDVTDWEEAKRNLRESVS